MIPILNSPPRSFSQVHLQRRPKFGSAPAVPPKSTAPASAPLPSQAPPPIDDKTVVQDSVGAKLSRAGTSLQNNLTSGHWWLNQGLIAGGITVATCWLPGSQLVTIPVWLAVSLAGDAVNAMFDPNAVGSHESSVSKPPASSKPPGQETLWDRGKGSLYGFGKGLWHGLVEHPVRNLLISAAICLATCWLPGSQLLLIPAFYAMNSAYHGVLGAIAGYQNPRLHLAKAPSINQSSPEVASK